MENLGIKLLALIFAAEVVMATTMLPVPIEDKVEASDAVVVGEVVSKTFKRHPLLNVVTQAKLKLKKSVGINHNDNHNSQFVNITYPGGKWADMVYSVPLAPNFEVGETAVVLLKNNKGAMFVHYLGAGKFNIINKDGVEYVKSEVFSNQKGVGFLKMKDFEKVLRRSHFNSGLATYHKRNEVQVVKTNLPNNELATGSGRSPASANIKQNHRKISSEEKAKKHNFTKGFLVFVFIVMGLFFSFKARNET